MPSPLDPQLEPQIHPVCVVSNSLSSSNDRLFIFNSNPSTPTVSFDDIPPALTGYFGAWANWHNLPELLRFLVAYSQGRPLDLSPSMSYLRLPLLRAWDHCMTYESQAKRDRYTAPLDPSSRRWVHGLMRTVTTDRLFDIDLQSCADPRLEVWKLTDYAETVLPDVKTALCATQVNAKHASLWREFVEATRGTSSDNGICTITMLGDGTSDGTHATVEVRLGSAWVLCDQQRVRGKRPIALRTKANIIYAAIALRAFLTAEKSTQTGTELVAHYRE